jgi:hypothetical protein
VGAARATGAMIALALAGAFVAAGGVRRLARSG